VLSYARTIKVCLDKGEVDEVKYVQPKMVTLLKGLSAILLPIESYNILSKSETGTTTVGYQTALEDSHGNIVTFVSGEVDEAVSCGDIVLLYVEDKNIGTNLALADNQAQARSELKAFGEAFERGTAKKAPSFWGLLQNGKRWQFLRRIVDISGVRMIMFTEIPVIDNGTINMDAVECASKFMMLCFQSVIELREIVESDAVCVTGDVGDLVVHEDDDPDDNCSEDDLNGEWRGSQASEKGARKRGTQQHNNIGKTSNKRQKGSTSSSGGNERNSFSLSEFGSIDSAFSYCAAESRAEMFRRERYQESLIWYTTVP
jgi:hypothetical protein